MNEDLLQHYTLPQDWVDLNIEAERTVRYRLKKVLDPAKQDPLLDDMPEQIQLSLYLYFAGFSCAMCRVFDPQGALYSFRDKCRSLSLQLYLGLCASLYAVKVISNKRHDPNAAHFSLSSAAIMCGQPESYTKSWLECCDFANDEDRFLSELSLRLYKAVAAILDLPRDEEALARARMNSIWNGVAMIASEDHKDLCQNDTCLKFARTAFELPLGS